MTGATFRAGTACPSGAPELTPGVALLLFVCLSVFFLSVFVTSYCDVSHSDDGIYKITSPVFCQAQ
jgi:hypothetical protein